VSIETTFRALLAANSGLTALVGSRIAQNVVAQGEQLPLVVFTTAHQPSLSSNGQLLATETTFTVQCWADDSVAADAVADAVTTAIGGTADVLARESGFDSELDLHSTVLVVQWWTV
jgi:hypothetical protein